MRIASIDAILFDLGGVVVELSGVEQMLGWSSGVADIAELWRRWLHSPSVRRFEMGSTSPEIFAVEVVAEFGVPVSPEAFLEAFTRWPRALLPGAVELLSELAPVYRLASVSNTNALHWERFCGHWQLDTHFHHNFPSFAVGKLKPDADYFEHVLEELGVPARRVLFVDDNAINVEGAARVGIVAHRVAGPADVRAVLESLAS